MKEKHLDNFVKGLKNGIPIALGYFAVAFTLGIQAKNAGITAFQSAVASFGLHASAGEYIAFTLFGANASVCNGNDGVCRQCQISFNVLCVKPEDSRRHPNMEKTYNGIFYNR